MLLERELAGVDPDREGAQGELNNALDRLTNDTAADDPASPGGGRVPRGAHHGPRRRGQPRSPRAPSRTCRSDLRQKRRRRAPLSRKYVTRRPSRASRCPTLMVGQPVRTANGDLEFYLLFPLDRRAAHARPGAEHADRRRARAAAAAGRHRQPRHAPGRAAGAAGRGDRRAVRRRPPRRADARAGRGRAGPARRVLQRDGAAASRSRSASWRSSARCSGGSPPTSATSCAPR